MIFSLLQTLIPALDSKFFQTMRNYSIATGDTQEVGRHWINSSQSLFVWSEVQIALYISFVYAVYDFRRCHTGGDVFSRQSEDLTPYSVMRLENDMHRKRYILVGPHEEIKDWLCMFLNDTSIFLSLCQAEELINDVYSSLKKKLTDLTWRDKTSSGFILNKVCCESYPNENTYGFCSINFVSFPD